MPNKPTFIVAAWVDKSTKTTHKRYCSCGARILGNGKCWRGCEVENDLPK